MSTTRPFVVLLMMGISAGCLGFGLSIGETHTYTYPTKAQELTELKDALTAQKITQQEYELAKNAVYTNQPISKSTTSAISLADHTTSK